MRDPKGCGCGHEHGHGNATKTAGKPAGRDETPIRVIYDLDGSLGIREEQAMLRVAGRELSLDLEKLQEFFEQILAVHGSYLRFEQGFREDADFRAAALEDMAAFMAVPDQPYPEVGAEEFQSVLLRFLFTVHQRRVKRFLCDTVLFPSEEG